MIRVRPAEPADARAAAYVHVRGWQTAYRGILPDAYLDNMDLAAREKVWAERLQDPERRGCTFVVTVDESVVGFAAGGAERDGLEGYDGELYAIYLLPEHRRQGLGRLLLAAVARCLLDGGFRSMLVWVLQANPSRPFYEALGGKRVAAKTITLAAGEHPEQSYGWPDLAGLVADLEATDATDPF